jgi:methyl-accepting chemotaxis protein
MAEQTPVPEVSNDEVLLQQQYLRALSSFEGIVLSQIDIKNKLGDRLNYSIRAGLIILGVIALSILVLLLTLSSQINRISDVVLSMNAHFSSVSDKMDLIRDDMVEMEQRVALLKDMQQHTASLRGEMQQISGQMAAIDETVGGISNHLGRVRGQVGSIALSIDRMNTEVQAMSAEMHRMGKPARSLNKMFPFP